MYSKYTALFICHPKDIEREVIPQGSRKDVVKEIIFPLREIIEGYRYSPVRNRIIDIAVLGNASVQTMTLSLIYFRIFSI